MGLETGPGPARAAFQAARAQILEHAGRFTRFSPDSELSQLNQAAGSWFAVSPQMFSVLQQAQECHRQTGGLFDPAVLPDLLRLGYNQDLARVRAQAQPGSQSGSAPATAPLSERQPGGRFAEMRLEQEAGGAGRAWLPPGVTIDLGGIAKGWIAQQAADLLSSHGNACTVSAGGDMVLHGTPAGESGWEIGLEDPCDPGQVLAVLHTGPGAIATSSITRRTWEQGGLRQHHLIDPRSRRPAHTGWLSVTALLPGVPGAAARAEAFAKALLIAGPGLADSLAGQQPGLAFIAVDENRSLWGSANCQEILYANS